MLNDNDIIKIGRYKKRFALKDIPEDYFKTLYVSLRGSISEQAYIQQLKEWIDNKYSFSDEKKAYNEELKKETKYIEIINKSCPKERFVCEQDAKNRLRQIKKEAEKVKEIRPHYKYPIRAYYCPKCGFYHLTSQVKRGYDNNEYSNENNDNETNIEYEFQHKDEWLKLLNKE